MGQIQPNSLSSASKQGCTEIENEDLLFMPMLGGYYSTRPDPNAEEGNLAQGVRD